MPKGVHNNHVGGFRKPTCLCGDCHVCKHRVINRRYKARIMAERSREAQSDSVSDSVLEQKLIDKFKEKGWD